MWAAKNFQEQIKHKYPTLDPLCLTCKNECDTEKLIMTFIKVGFNMSYTVLKFQRAYPYLFLFCNFSPLFYHTPTYLI